MKFLPGPTTLLFTLLPLLALSAPDARQRCGTPSYPKCPIGSSCIPNPGIHCQPLQPCPGHCSVPIYGEKCGGILGTPCETSGEICVDDPRDDCDPKKGGDDCIGVCVKRVTTQGWDWEVEAEKE